MKYLFSAEMLVSILLSLLGTILLFSICFWFLRKQKLLVSPYNGMEWGTVIFSSAILFGVMMISTSYIEPIFQATKVYYSKQQDLGPFFKNSLSLFSEFFIIVFLLIAIYLLMVLIGTRLLPGERKVLNEVRLGNISLSVIMAVFALGLGFFFKEIAEEVMKPMVPYVINFR